MVLVMMLITYTMIEIPLHMCMHVHVPVQPCAPTPPNTQMRLTQNTISEICFHTNKNLITSASETERVYLHYCSSLSCSQREDLRAVGVESQRCGFYWAQILLVALGEV